MITGLSVNITPKFSNSLIRLDGHFFGELGHEDNTFNHTIAFMRDSTGLHETPVGNRNYGYGMITRTYRDLDLIFNANSRNWLYL